mmetsp:Transcript_24531/g.51183  ORF Transcript_24531/g.51183 Transcript_24531/m.51183 type:complete len:262 (+) Transcript_24531:176-961(+)
MILLITTISIILTNLVLTNGIIVDIKSGEEFCITLHPQITEKEASILSLPSTPTLTALAGNFDYLTSNGSPSDSRPISATVSRLKLSSGQYGETIHDSYIYQSEYGEQESTFLIDIHKDGGEGDEYIYEYCVGNGVGKPRGVWPNEFGDTPQGQDGKDRKIGLSFRGLEEYTSTTNPKSPPSLPPGYSSALEESRTLLSSLKTMQDSQSYSRRREAIHRDVSESTNERVYKWTIAEAIVLVGMGTGQIFYLRSFFEKTRRL